MFLNAFFMLKDSAYPVIVVLAIALVGNEWGRCIPPSAFFQSFSHLIGEGFRAPQPLLAPRRGGVPGTPAATAGTS